MGLGWAGLDSALEDCEAPSCAGQLGSGGGSWCSHLQGTIGSLLLQALSTQYADVFAYLSEDTNMVLAEKMQERGRAECARL